MFCISCKLLLEQTNEAVNALTASILLQPFKTHEVSLSRLFSPKCRIDLHKRKQGKAWQGA